MVPVAHPHQHEAAPKPPDNNRHITKLCTAVFFRLLLLCYTIWSVYLLVMQPKPPKYNVESGTVQLNQQESQLTAQWGITVLGTNPTRYFKINHKRVEAGVLYQTRPPREVTTLVRMPWPSFVLKERNQTRMEFKFSVWQTLLDYRAAQEMSSQLGNFGLRFRSRRLWFVSKLLPPEPALLHVTCDIPHDNGSITSTSRYSGLRCQVWCKKIYVYEVLVICSYIAIACIKGGSRRKTAAHIGP